MKAARFPAYKDLSGFDFAASEINEATMRQLHKCEFMDAAPSIVLIHCPPLGIIPWMTLPGNGTGYCEAMSQEGAVLAQAKRMPPSCWKHASGVTLGVQAVEHYRRKVRFFSTIELVNALEVEKAKGKAGHLAESLTKLDLVILPSHRCKQRLPGSGRARIPTARQLIAKQSMRAGRSARRAVDHCALTRF